MKALRLAIYWMCVLALAGCGGTQIVSPATQAPRAAQAPVRLSATPLAQPAGCTGAFVAHTLDFSTELRGDTAHLFDSNGAGVAIGDLDGDGRPDLVFANLDGPNTIFWNQGDFAFHRQTLDDSGSRAVNLVDVDGDGLLDIVFTYRSGSVGYWRNLGGAHFARKALPGVLAPAYSMAWADLNGDGALDLVTGSYDAELAKRNANTFLFSAGAGVFFYQHQGTAYKPQRLASTAQALAIALPDLNGDGRPDILVGNDFDMPDQSWLRVGDGWAAGPQLAATAESTMSIDQGDIDNDGTPEIFATDMKPYGLSTGTLAEWLPLMATMPQIHAANDPQIMENVLQVRGADGALHNQAYGRGVDATGWSWSAKFGDLDNDGFLDLYVVNGMIAAELFHHLPHDELVEQNQALHNDGTGHFAPAPQWELGSTSSGRGMSMADLNGDGKLDIVVSNLRAPAMLFENRLCGGQALEVDLAWPGSQNTRAIGAVATLHTSAGTYTRDVRAGSGYLSGDPARIHFGVPAGATIDQLEIRWPDGAISSIAQPQPQTIVTVTRGG